MIPGAGTRLGRYEIRSKIGEGGMGEVYRARDEKLNRDVAVKVLPSQFSQNSDRLRRFEQEAQAAGALNHPNILAVYDVGVHENAPYVVSELLAGETLGERLLTGPMAQRKAIDYAIQVAHGLSAAHERRIVHRDLKPENLFITKNDLRHLRHRLCLCVGRQERRSRQVAKRDRRNRIPLLSTVRPRSLFKPHQTSTGGHSVHGS